MPGRFGRWLETEREVWFRMAGALSYLEEQVRELKEQGMSIVIVSSDITDIEAMCDRVLVFYKGEIAAEFAQEDISSEKLAAAAMGVKSA